MTRLDNKYNRQEEHFLLYAKQYFFNADNLYITTRYDDSSLISFKERSIIMTLGKIYFDTFSIFESCNHRDSTITNFDKTPYEIDQLRQDQGLEKYGPETMVEHLTQANFYRFKSKYETFLEYYDHNKEDYLYFIDSDDARFLLINEKRGMSKMVEAIGRYLKDGVIAHENQIKAWRKKT